MHRWHRSRRRLSFRWYEIGQSWVMELRKGIPGHKSYLKLHASTMIYLHTFPLNPISTWPAVLYRVHLRLLGWILVY